MSLKSYFIPNRQRLQQNRAMHLYVGLHWNQRLQEDCQFLMEQAPIQKLESPIRKLFSRFGGMGDGGGGGGWGSNLLHSESRVIVYESGLLVSETRFLVSK